MTEKNPKKRITLDKVKQHPFFSSIDWGKLAKRELKPPVDLAGGGIKKEESMVSDDAEEMAFFNSAVKKEVLFDDQDYTEQDFLKNRLKKFTFIEGRSFDKP